MSEKERERNKFLLISHVVRVRSNLLEDLIEINAHREKRTHRFLIYFLAFFIVETANDHEVVVEVDEEAKD